MDILCMHNKWFQWCSTLCNPTDYSPPGSSVSGILPARILEYVAMCFSRGSSPPRDQTHVVYVSFIARLLVVICHLCHLGRPCTVHYLIKSSSLGHNFSFILFMIILGNSYIHLINLSGYLLEMNF